MANKPRARVYNIMQYERHPETGEVLLLEDTIKIALAHKSILKWAYIKHDRDMYSEKDEQDDPSHKQGMVKPPHWHIVLRMKSNDTELPTIAKWFGIKENFVDMPKGHGAFLDCVEYLVHDTEKQQGLGKVLYNDSEVQSNFDWREELVKRDMLRAKWGRKGDTMTEKQVMGQRIMLQGLTLAEAKAEDPILYADNLDYFRKVRGEYLASQPAPQLRINYYVCGSGGVGKGLFSRGVARALFPDKEYDEDIFFEVGADKVGFEGYDGQPVVIWNDHRAYDLITKLGGRENVFNVFDSHPTKQRQNIKYGSTSLINTVNIINSVQPYQEFLDGLAGEYTTKDGTVYKSEDKNQSYRRFPLITEIREEDFDLYINRGFMENNRAFDQYIAYENVRGNMQKIAVACGNNQKLARELTSRTLGIVTEKYHEIEDKLNAPELSEAEIREMFKDYGQQVQQLLNLFKTQQQIENQRKRHERAQAYRQGKSEQIDLMEIINDDSLPWG